MLPRIFKSYFKMLLLLAFIENVILLDANPRQDTTMETIRLPDYTSITQRQSVTDLINPYVNTTIDNPQPTCVQTQCKVICIRTHINKLNKSIENALSSNDTKCSSIEELYLYHSQFPQQKISYGFLGIYSNKVRALYISSANVTDIEKGAFRNGVFKDIYLEDLQLNVLRKDIFHQTSMSLSTFSIIQHNKPIESIYDDFLGHIKYQLRSLTLQVGLREITNVTSSSSLLNNLKTIDLSNNDFTNTLTDESFAKLWIVEYMDLSNSRIESLPIYIFSQLTDSLLYLNISHNKLITIDHLIFGRHSIDESLLIEAHNNPWNCSCTLRQEMEELMKQQHSDRIICKTPAKQKGLSIWDERICPSELNVTTSNKIIGKSTTPMIPSKAKTTTIDPNVIYITNTTTSGVSPVDTILLQCLTPGSKTKSQWTKVSWSDTHIHLTALPELRVAVNMTYEEYEKPYGIMWFSKVIDDFYKMTINYDKYGLGCMNHISFTTIISHLLPNTSYTVCLIGSKQPTIPPFHCESIHLDTNLKIIYADSISHHIYAVDISLIILGVVLCCFLGITVIYLLFKYKPTLLKGSKRVTTTDKTPLDIVILPKKSSLEDLKMKEEKLVKESAKRSTSSSTVRRSSVVSVESSQSYINANLYEVIPAYLRLQGATSGSTKKSVEFESIGSYMPPLIPKLELCDESLVGYAEVAARSKRASNDPLPALPPTEQSEMPPSLATTDVVDHTISMQGSMWSIKVSDEIL